MKKFIIISMSLVLCLGLLGGAFAYFTDVENSNDNVMQAGTLNIQIQDNNEGPLDGAVHASFSSPAGFAPGQTFTTDPVIFRNVGSIGIPYIFGAFDITSESVMGMADQIILLSYAEKSSNSLWVPSSDQAWDGDWSVEEFDEDNANSYLSYWHLTEDGSISLQDLVDGVTAGDSHLTSMWFYDSDGHIENPACPVGGWAQLKFTFKFLPTANNNFQGASATFDVYFVAAQTDADLDTYITEPMP
jgi:predicted ribosomally synthesized peptide with SipW-like signal peptide